MGPSATELFDYIDYKQAVEFWNLPQCPVPYAIIEYVIKMGHTIKYRFDPNNISTPICDILSHGVYLISLYFRDDHIRLFNLKVVWMPGTNIGINISYADPHLFELIDRYLEL